MEIVTAIVEKVAEPIVDYTVAPIARQVGYLIFYKDNFNNLKDQVARLKEVKDTIIREVETERRNGRQIYDAVQNWLDKVDEIIEEAEQLEDHPGHRNVGCCKGPFLDLKSRHQLSRKAKKMAGNVVEVMQGKDNIGPLTFLPDLEGVGSISATSSEKLESRKKMKEDIILALRDSNLSRIGVYGLGGVGKTTLVREIAKQVKDDKLFDEVVMANISQNADLERIQGEIADFLGLRIEETTIIGRASRLRQRIKTEKSILIILDDIWAILELDKLGIPMNDHKGCKLLLTSRNQDILQKMETQKDFLINVLNESAAWSLFEDMVGDVVKDVSLRDLAIQVAQKCAGLIVLIVTVARALKNKDNIDSWKDALNQLKTVDKEGMNEKIYSVLEFSYSHLEGDDVKALFLLCGFLGPQIGVEYLLKCVMGLGIFKQNYTPKDARLKLHRLIGSLKASCLLLENDSNKEVKMHDIVREVAVSIASRDQHVYRIGRGDELKPWPSEEFLQRCTQIIINCPIPELPERLECPNINFFCLCNIDESLSVPDSFFEGMKNLKVLDLNNLYLPSLPQSFHSLIDLKTLCLHFCVLGDMTNIGALTNLEILSLHGSSMITLPSELGQLTHLRMLYLTESGIEIFPSNIIPKLTKLEELYLGNTSIKWDQEHLIDENKNTSLSELRHLTNLEALEIHIKGAWVLPRNIMFDKLERYKIVIGDAWEWSDNFGTSKMLKLKLGTVIHLEHGIKELIEGVEGLYLDEVNGISNVLYDLNGEGFPLLKHLHIQNNGKIQCIIDSRERKISHIFFPKLETLILQNLNILEKICHGSFMNNSFTRLRTIKVKCCDQLKHLLSTLMVKALCQLVEIEVSKCRSMTKIVSIENSFPNLVTIDDNIEFCSLRSLNLRYLPAIEDFYSSLLTSSTTTEQRLSLVNNVPSSFFNAKVKFSNLETLKLSSIHLENIWNDDQLSVANSFHNLSKLSIKECGSLKYLFSSSTVGGFPNLKELEIRECEMMEEIIATKGRNDAAIEEVGLQKLEIIIISNMKRLKKVWHSQFEGLKSVEVNNCEKLENIFPSDMHTTFGRMETLKVSNCGSVEEIFKLLPVNDINSEEDTRTQVTQLKKLHLLYLPKLKQIWSNDPQGNFHFHNLQDVHVEDCLNLEYLFPFSIALDLHQIEKLTLDFCGMREIVAKKEGTVEEKAIFHFDHLYSLEILNMHQLNKFYSGSHSLTCPSLRMLKVFNCAKLKLLGRQSTSNHRKNVDHQNPHRSTQQPLFIIEEVIPKLEDWTLNNEEAIMMLQDPQWEDCYLSKLKVLQLSDFEDEGVAATFLDSIVEKAPLLKCLIVHYGSLKEIFRDKRVAFKEGNKYKTNPQLESLRLTNLPLQHLCKEGCKIDPILESLEVLYVIACANLKTLVPSSVTFSHLIYLEIDKCNGLINLICSSTATSLVNLQGITLKECNSLEEIVTQGVNETRDEIVFRSLRTLELESLPRLNSFSSSQCFFRLPILDKVVVSQCARMKTFCEIATSTPMLRKVIIKRGKDEKWCWEGDLNGTIKNMYVDKVAFSSSNYLEFSEYPELKELWYGPVGQKIFCNLKHLVVCKCTFLSNAIFTSNLLQLLYTLEELQVADCDSLEAVFDVKALDDRAMKSKEVSRLKKLTLSRLPNLKRIWNTEAGEIISFRNLQNVKVDECQHLKNLFSVSLCQDLRQLEEIDIVDCGFEDIVSIEEGLEELNFYFPLLRIFRLIRLTQLKVFYPKRYTLECPSLKILNVGRCEALQIFAFGHWDSQQLGRVCVDLPIQQALFHIEKVSENLEELSLNGKDAMRILNGNYEKKLFQRIERLRLQYFQETPIKFINEVLERFPGATTLQARWSSFETLFPTGEISHFNIRKPTQIKALSLFQLEQLEQIWNEDSASDKFVPNLEFLTIRECSRLIRLAPPLTCFTNLTTLILWDCNGLMYFMTSFTAKSLVHLTSISVKNCRMLEEVVITNEGGSEEEIIFESLEDLELVCLSRFKSFCFGKHTFIFPSLVTLKVTGCQKMQNFSYGNIVAPFLKLVEVENGGKCWKGDLNTTIKHLFIDKAIGEGDEWNYKESSSDITKSSQTHQMSARIIEASCFEEQVGQSKPNHIPDTRKQETHKIPSQSYDKKQNEKASSGIERPLAYVTQNASSPSTNQDAGLAVLEESQGSKTQSSKNLFKQATTDNNKESLAKGTQEMGENIEKPLDEADKIALSPTGVYDADVNETIEKPLIQTTQEAQRQGSHESKTCPRENLFNRPTTFATSDKKENIGTQEIHDNMDKLLIQSYQDAEKLVTAQRTEVSRDSYIESQKICNIVNEPSIPATQNVLDSIMIPEAAIDPSHSQAPKPMILSIQKSNIYGNYKGTIDIPESNMPYLDAGVKRHPKVLDWLNTKRRRVFASSFFSLFAEVTHILRTTRRIDLTEDDQNYIRECCAALQGVGFDDSWISYVHGCIEECEDGEDLEKKVEEAEGQASNLNAQLESIKKELASVEESLALLRHKASRLHNFIES